MLKYSNYIYLMEDDTLIFGNKAQDRDYVFARLPGDVTEPAFLLDIHVSEENRHQGLGSFLIEVLIAAARKRGYNSIEGIYSPREAAESEVRAFYAKHGFVVETRPYDGIPGNPEMDYVVKKL
jgi:GNAT superfamily N-acetyltransferase